MSSVKIIDKQLLDGLCLEASTLPRRRKNLNLHTSLEDPVQRLFIAMQTDSFLRPHRHQEKEKTELLIAIRGSFAALIFDDKGTVIERIDFSSAGEIFAVELKPKTWHTVIALDDDSVLFEVKQGPYTALSDKDFAVWAPEENSPDVAPYLRGLQVADSDV